jgi:hypothetical protein
MASRVYLHVGTMKSATTYIQALCDERVDDLAASGVLWFGSNTNFAAVNDFDRSGEDGHDPLVWNGILRQIEGHDGSALISHELLSLRTKRRVQALVAAFDGAGVKVILTARDPGRILASQWQERAQRGRAQPWSEFMRSMMADGSQGDRELRWFWRRQDLSALVEKFAGVVGIENVFVVTVPQSPDEPGLLASRFFSVLGVAPPREPTSVPIRNASPGAHSVELMGRLLGRLTDEEGDRLHVPVKYVLGRGVMAGRRAKEPAVGLTADQLAWVTDYAEGAIERLRESGVRIVGDLDDLRPGDLAYYEGADPSLTTDAELVDAALDTIVALLDVIERMARDSDGARSGETLRRLSGPDTTAR